MPAVELIDMRRSSWKRASRPPSRASCSRRSRERLENGEQTIVLLNRRGFSSFVACRACGERVQCVNCSLTLTYHQRDRRLLCHYCNYAEKVPSVCPQVPERAHLLPRRGLGEAWRRSCTASSPPRASRGWTATPSPASASTRPSCRASARAAYDILVGTQMIAKGHDIPNVTLVGVVSADVGPRHARFPRRRAHLPAAHPGGRARRARRTAGHRADPDHQPGPLRGALAAAQDYGAFYEKELNFRRMMRYPPFSAMANVLVRSEKQEEALRMSAELGALPDARAGEDARDGAGRSARAAAQERVPLPVPDQGGQPQGAQRAAARARSSSPWRTSGPPPRW